MHAIPHSDIRGPVALSLFPMNLPLFPQKRKSLPCLLYEDIQQTEKWGAFDERISSAL